MNFENLKNTVEFKKIEYFYRCVLNNVISVTNMGKDELKITRLIAWLFTPYESHNLGFFPLECLIEEINDGCFKYKLSDLSLDEVKIVTEKSIIIGDEKRRIDLLIEFTSLKFAIVFENKITSLENDNQTKMYADWAELKYGKGNYLLIYLSSNGDEEIDVRFIYKNYQLIMNIVQRCLEKLKSQSNSVLIAFYNALMAPNGNIDSQVNNEYVLAYSNKEKDLLDGFWNKYQNDILFILNNSKRDSLKRFKQNDIFVTILIKLKLMNKFDSDQVLMVDNFIANSSKVNVFEQDGKVVSYSNADFIYEVLKNIIEDKNIQNLNDFGSIMNSTNQPPLLIKEDANSEQERIWLERNYYRESKKNQSVLKVGNKECYYLCNVLGEEIESFIKAVSVEFPEYKNRIYRS